MKTGLKSDEISIEKQAFVLSFLAIIWRRVLITVYIYCQHNSVPISSNVVLKCLKYNILSPTGIGNTLKPYLSKALDVGFLMPEDYRGNVYAERAVKLFNETYTILKRNDRSEMNFVHDYAASAFEKTNQFWKEETEDTIIPPENTNENDHSCKLCSLIDSWDVNLGLINSEDPYQNVLMYGALTAFDTYSSETDTNFNF